MRHACINYAVSLTLVDISSHAETALVAVVIISVALFYLRGAVVGTGQGTGRPTHPVGGAGCRQRQ